MSLTKLAYAAAQARRSLKLLTKMAGDQELFLSLSAEDLIKRALERFLRGRNKTTASDDLKKAAADRELIKQAVRGQALSLGKRLVGPQILTGMGILGGGTLLHRQARRYLGSKELAGAEWVASMSNDPEVRRALGRKLVETGYRLRDWDMLFRGMNALYETPRYIWPHSYMNNPYGQFRPWR